MPLVLLRKYSENSELLVNDVTGQLLALDFDWGNIPITSSGNIRIIAVVIEHRRVF